MIKKLLTKTTLPKFKKFKNDTLKKRIKCLSFFKVSYVLHLIIDDKSELTKCQFYFNTSDIASPVSD